MSSLRAHPLVLTLSLGMLLAALGCSASRSATTTVEVAPKTHPVGTEKAMLVRAIPSGQKLCYVETAWISGIDRHYAVLITQPACGASTYVHQWLHRDTTTASATWKTLGTRTGTIDHPAGCSANKAIPADIRCS